MARQTTLQPLTSNYRRWRWVVWCLALAYVAALTTLCLLPVQDLPSVQLSDKLEHLLVFIPFAVLFRALFPRSFWRVLLAGVLLGGAIEIAQGLSGYRDAEWLDWLADIVGVALGSLFMTRLLRSALSRQWLAQHKAPASQ